MILGVRRSALPLKERAGTCAKACLLTPVISPAIRHPDWSNFRAGPARASRGSATGLRPAALRHPTAPVSEHTHRRAKSSRSFPKNCGVLNVNTSAKATFLTEPRIQKVIVSKSAIRESVYCTECPSVPNPLKQVGVAPSNRVQCRSGPTTFAIGRDKTSVLQPPSSSHSGSSVSCCFALATPPVMRNLSVSS